MSQIFDALHQSVSERSGSVSHDFAAARELLQVAERKVSNAVSVLDRTPEVASREAQPDFPSASVILPQFSKFVCFGQDESLAGEKFRFLATRLRHLQQKHGLKRLVVTSSVAGEGKSMVAANLSHSLAAGKQQVLLLEGDLRRPSLGSELGLGELPGLSQALRDGNDDLNIYRLGSSGLCVLLAGDVHSSPLDFMEPGKLSTLMDRASIYFDWVVIDSPPVLPLADTSMWMRLADAILLVTRPGVTSKRQLQRTIEAIEQPKLLGWVLNASTEATANHYYHQYVPRSSGSPVAATIAK